MEWHGLNRSKLEYGLDWKKTLDLKWGVLKSKNVRTERILEMWQRLHTFPLVYVHACVYACVHILCVNMCVCMHVNICAHVYACMYVNVYICDLCIYMHAYVYVCECVHMCIYVYMYMCLCGCVCVCAGERWIRMDGSRGSESHVDFSYVHSSPKFSLMCSLHLILLRITAEIRLFLMGVCYFCKICVLGNKKVGNHCM